MRIKLKELRKATEWFMNLDPVPYSIRAIMGKDCIKFISGKHTVYLYDDHDELKKKPERTIKEEL